MSMSDSHSEVRSSPREEEHQMTFQICRGCLSVDAISPANSSLAQAFAQVTGVQWDNERLSRALCVQCKALLTKCIMYREKAQRVNDALMQMMISNDLNLTNINKMKRKQLRIKPLLEPTHYSPNHCDLYHDADNALSDENNSTDQYNEPPQEIRFVVVGTQSPRNSQMDIKNNFEHLLKSLKNEIVYSTDQVNSHNEEEDVDTSVIDDEGDSEVADIVDSKAMAVDIPDIRHSSSSPDLSLDNNTSAASSNIVKQTAPNPHLLLNFEELSKSPKKEVFDSPSGDVDLDNSDIEDEENIKIADLMDSTTMMVGNTDFGNKDSSPKLCYREAKESPSISQLIITDMRNNFEDLLKSPKREFTDSLDQDDSRNGEVDLDTSVNGDDEDVKVADLVDNTTTADVTSDSDKDTEAPSLKRKLKFTEERQYNQEIKHHLKTPAKLVTKDTDNAPSSSVVTETPAVTNKFTTKHYRFICDKCNFIFKSKEILEGHLSKCDGSMNGDKPLYRKSGQGTLVEHRYACNLCSYKSRRLQCMQRHIICHTAGKPHACKICDSKFSDSSYLQEHMRTHTGEKPHACNICGRKFNRSYGLKRHMEMHTGEKPYTCNICDRKFSQSNNLKLHMRTHTGEKPYVCNICDRKFSDSSYLQVHIRTHTGERPHTCNICGRKFNVSNVLKKHMRTHTGEKPYVCNICDRKFSDSSYLQVHIRTHTGERPHTCNICGRKYIESYVLKRHMRTHTGEKPYVCNICDRKFSDSSYLQVHIRTHTGERPHTCNICGRKFNESNALKRHMRIHTGEKPYVCNICSRKFNQSNILINHLRTHTGEKPHACNMCDRKFSNSFDLKLHIRIHTGEKPYACNICGSKFNRPNVLKSHMIKHTIKASCL